LRRYVVSETIESPHSALGLTPFPAWDKAQMMKGILLVRMT